MNRPSIPEKFTPEWFVELVEYLGGNSAKIEPYDGWKAFIRKYPELKEADRRKNGLKIYYN